MSDPYIPSDDSSYATWRANHPEGVVVTRTSRKAPFVFHRTDCPHISDHMRSGALTSSKNTKRCFASVREAREWVNKQPDRVIPVSRNCQTCS